MKYIPIILMALAFVLALMSVFYSLKSSMHLKRASLQECRGIYALLNRMYPNKTYDYLRGERK
jgi:hypothetical protein